MAKRGNIDFVSSAVEGQSKETNSLKKTCMYDLRTGKPFDIPESDQYGRCRPVTDFEKLNRIGEGTYGIVYRARDTKTGKSNRMLHRLTENEFSFYTWGILSLLSTLTLQFVHIAFCHI